MKTEASKFKKVILIIAILIILAGGVVIYTIGFHVGLDYSASQNIKIYFETSYEDTQIEQIVKDVFGNGSKRIQDIELFHDAVSITVKEVNEEQINNLKQRVSQIYNIEDIESHIIVNDMPSYRLRDVMKPYILPLTITTVAIFAYLAIRFRKIGMKKALLLPLGLLIILEAVYISIIAICRIPLGRYMIPIALLIYVATFVYTLARLAKIEEMESPKTKIKKK